MSVDTRYRPILIKEPLLYIISNLDLKQNNIIVNIRKLFIKYQFF